MFQKNDKNETIWAVIIWAVAINALVFYFVLSQFSGTRAIDKSWKENATSSIQRASHLAAVERNLGYLGFIHHYKNYILRREQADYDKAVVSYDKIIGLLQQLRVSTSDGDNRSIAIIESTLNTYYQKLLFAHDEADALSISQLDAVVVVDDEQARIALSDLRKKLLPQLTEQTASTDRLVEKQKNQTYAAFILLPLFLLSTLFTIRLIKTLYRLNAEYTTIFNITPDGILFADDAGHILRANQAACDIFGYEQDELQQMSVEDLMDPEMREKHNGYRKAFSQTEQSRQMRSLGSGIHGRKKDGSIIDLSIAISSKVINDAIHSVCVIRDMTTQNQLKTQAERDYLTLLYNRRTIENLIKEEISRSQRLDKAFSLILIDIDNFKEINDNFGHKRGDEAIKTVVNHIEKHIRPYDHLGRWGGDEFLLLCPELEPDESTVFADRIRDEIEQLAQFSDCRITLSMGVATFNKDQHQYYDDLMHDADLALYKAKENGRNQVIHSQHV